MSLFFNHDSLLKTKTQILNPKHTYIESMSEQDTDIKNQDMKMAHGYSFVSIDKSMSWFLISMILNLMSMILNLISVSLMHCFHDLSRFLSLNKFKDK